MDGTVKLWPMRNDVLSPCGAERLKIASFDLSPADDSLLLMVDTDQQVHLWNLEHNLPASDLEHENSVRSAFFSPDGNRIVTVHEQDIEIKLWSKNGKFIKKCCKHSDPILSAKYSPEGGFIATSTRSIDEGIKLWTENGELFEIPTIKGEPISRIKFSPNGKRIFVQSESKILILDRSRKKSPLEMNIQDYYNVNVSFSPDSRRLLVANGNELSVFDFEAQKNPTVIKDNEIYLHYILWLPNGDGFLAASTSGQVGVWDRNGKVRYTWSSLGESGSFSPLVSPDGDIVFNTKTGALFNLQGERLNSIDLDRFIKYLPDGKYILTVLRGRGRDDPNTLHLRDRYGNIVVSLGEINGDIIEAKISNSGKLIAIQTSNNNLVLRCTPAGIYDDLNKTNLYKPDSFDRLKYGIDW